VPGALHFFAPSEPGPLAAAVGALLGSELADPDPLVRQLAEELSISSTVDRYLTLAGEAIAERRA